MVRDNGKIEGEIFSTTPLLTRSLFWVIRDSSSDLGIWVENGNSKNFGATTQFFKIHYIISEFQLVCYDG